MQAFFSSANRCIVRFRTAPVGDPGTCAALAPASYAATHRCTAISCSRLCLSPAAESPAINPALTTTAGNILLRIYPPDRGESPQGTVHDARHLALSLLFLRYMKDNSSDQPGLQRDPDEWKTGDEPMTAAQRSYLETLARDAGETFGDEELTKAEASKRIDELRERSPRVSDMDEE